MSFLMSLALAALPFLPPAGDALPESLSRTGPATDDAGPRFTLAALARVTLADGTVSEPTLFDDEVAYSDLFDPGVGFRLELGVLWGPKQGWSIGPFLAIGLDEYGGSSFTDSAGDSIEPEDLEAWTVLAGFRGVYSDSEGLFADLRGALGVVAWSDVDATFVLGGSPIPGVALFDGVTRLAFELGTRVGYRTGPVAFLLGIGMTIAGGPSRGSDVSDVVDPGPVVGFAFELGVEIGF